MTTPPARPGWWKRNWKWFVPVTLVSLFLLGAVVIGLIVTLVLGSIKSSVPYTRALAQAKTNPALLAEMGSPIEAGWYVTGSIRTSGSGSFADLSFPIHGPQKSGMLHVVASKNPFAADTDDWKIRVLEAKLTGRDEPIALLEETSSLPVAETQDIDDQESEVDAEAPATTAADVKAISGGVLNSKAISLPQPVYPPAAKAVGATGTVTVQVIFDEDGEVISATPVSGHPLLRAVAAAAARTARFHPVIVGGERVKVSGVVTYDFAQQ